MNRVIGDGGCEDAHHAPLAADPGDFLALGQCDRPGARSTAELKRLATAARMRCARRADASRRDQQARDQRRRDLREGRRVAAAAAGS